MSLHILMLGWEFPPFITGGLGTACYGLTRALDRRGSRVTFVLPKPVDDSHAAHVSLVSPGSPAAPGASLPDDHEWVGVTGLDVPGASPTPQAPGAAGDPGGAPMEPSFRRTRFLGIPAPLPGPYDRPGQPPAVTAFARRAGAGPGDVPGEGDPARDPAAPPPAGAAARDIGHPQPPAGGTDPGSGYDGNLVAEVQRYARFCVAQTRHLAFDVIHAHDWMTWPAGLAIARVTGRPLVVHVHSTEYDRAGEQVHPQIFDLERRGMHGAVRVITVSQLTKSAVVRRYGVPADRVDVVYNGVEIEPARVGIEGIRSRDKIVLYFGRITYQKGPEYFVRAAKRVLEVMDDVKFVVAGSGDMATTMIELAAEMGIGHRVLFTGFLRGDDIARVFALADLYVMPSISEPFGIAPLEAMSHDVPVLISRSSGVSEVLSHALKVDFWDVDDMANKIIAVLRHPPLSQTLRRHGGFEVRRLTWDGAAARCEEVYQQALEGMHQVVH